MTSPAIYSATPAINSNRPISPISLPPASDRSPTLRNTNKHNHRSNLIRRIRSSASDSTATIENLNPASASEQQNPVKIGARVRVKVPLKVYHIPKVPELDLNGKEGKVKEYVAVWKGKQISANLPYKIEFFEVLEGRGEAPVRFFAHLKEDEFDYID